jgi:hypothetical protein
MELPTAIDYMKPEYIYQEMEKLNIKIFGSFEACKVRLLRFYEAENKRKLNGAKTVHVETIPVINDSDKKIIHVAVNTDDVLDVAHTLMDLKRSEVDNLDSLIEKYKRFLVDAVILPDIYADYKTRSQMESYIEWKNAHKEFIKNGFISSIING